MRSTILSLLSIIIFILIVGCGGGSHNSGSSSFNQGANNQWLIYAKSGGIAETATKTISLSFEKETFAKNTIIKLEEAVAPQTPDNSLVQIGGCRFTYIAATKETSAVSYPKQLNKPAMLTVKLNPARNPSDSIKVYWADDIKPNVLEEYSTMQIAIDGKAASCNIEHFGYFYIFANPKSDNDKPYEYISPVQKLAVTTSTAALKLSWEKPVYGEIAGYKVSWVKSLTEHHLLTPNLISDTTFTDTQALAFFKQGNKVTYRVVAISKNGTTGWPAEVSVKLPLLPYKFSLFRNKELFPFVFENLSGYTYLPSSNQWVFASSKNSELLVFNDKLIFEKSIKPSSNLKFNSPSILRVTKDENIACYDNKTNEILLIDKEFTKSSKLLSFKPEFGTVLDIYCDTSNRIWVLFKDHTTAAVRVFDNQGKQVSAFGEKGSKNDQVNQPIAFCSRQNGGIYLLDKIDNNEYRIKIFNELGQFLGFFQFIDDITNSRLAGIKTLNNPTSLAEFKDGRVMIADTGNKRVLVVGLDFRLNFVYWFEEENKTKLDPDSTTKYQVYKFNNGPTNLLIEPSWNTLAMWDYNSNFVCVLKSTDE